MTSLFTVALIIKSISIANGQVALIESLPDTAFTASTSWTDDPGYLPYFCKSSSVTGWGPDKGDENTCWLLIDLGQNYVITSITTWGAGGEYVKTYTLNYATNFNSFLVYPTTINANPNKDTEVNNILVPPFIARYLRFHPQTYKSWPSMSVEAFGYIGTLPPSKDPTRYPTENPTGTTTIPTPSPTDNPTPAPTKNPTAPPTNNPTNTPTQPTSIPTGNPTTSAPITAIPTTPMPTTAIPTTHMPTTAIPTTAMPTTHMPTTFPTTDHPTTGLPTTATPTTVYPTTDMPTTSPIIEAEGQHKDIFDMMSSDSLSSEVSSEDPTDIGYSNAQDTTNGIIITIIYSVSALIAFIILIIGLACCYRIRMEKQINGNKSDREIIDMTIVNTDTPTTFGGVGTTTMGVIRLSSQSHISREDIHVNGTNGNYNGEMNDESDNDSLYEGNRSDNLYPNTPAGDMHTSDITPQGPHNDMYGKGSETKQ